MSKERNTLQDYLDGNATEENKNIEGTVSTKEVKKDKKKNKIIALIALLLAGVTTIGVLVGFKNKNKNKSEEQTTTTTIVSMDDLGMEEEFETNSQYGEITGNVKKEDIVEKDGVYYADKESADKSDKVGQTKIDTQNGKLEVKPNGTVVEKETGFEVKDEKGEVVTKGDNEEDLLKDYIILDKNYYYKDGTLAFNKGEKVEKKDFDRVKHLLITDPKQATETTTPSTTTPSTTTPSTTKQETTTENFTPAQGTVNNDGTYSIDGLTFESKADYQQWIIQGYEGYGIDSKDGIMKPIEKISSNGKTK